MLIFIEEFCVECVHKYIFYILNIFIHINIYNFLLKILIIEYLH